MTASAYWGLHPCFGRPDKADLEGRWVGLTSTLWTGVRLGRRLALQPTDMVWRPYSRPGQYWTPAHTLLLRAEQTGSRALSAETHHRAVEAQSVQKDAYSWSPPSQQRKRATTGIGCCYAVGQKSYRSTSCTGLWVAWAQAPGLPA